MAFVDNMLATFTIIILLMNAILLSFTGLPSNVLEPPNQTYYSFGLTDSQLSDLNSSFIGVVTDSNNIGSTTSDAFSSSTTEQTSQSIFDEILLGINKGVDIVVGTVTGVYSLVAGIVKYLFYLLVGYVFWIDYFLAPLQGQGPISGIFNNFGFGLKSFFFLIQLIGFTKIILPIFTGGRTT